MPTGNWIMVRKVKGALSDKEPAVRLAVVASMSNPFRYFNSSPEVIPLVWWNRFGPMFAAEIRKRRVAHMRRYPQWRWHLDEVFVKINGKLCYLWRPVDHEGEVLEAVVTARRDKAAALKLLKRIMKKYGPPRSVVTDGLCSYSAAMKEFGAADRHEVGGCRSSAPLGQFEGFA
jgi:hypothetical protein